MLNTQQAAELLAHLAEDAEEYVDKNCPTTDELQLIGDRTVRDAVAPMLRNYVTYVMPAIFPAASMRMGHDAVKTPFDLILLLLCE